MKILKKFMAVLTVCVIVSALFTACKSDKDTNDGSNTQNTAVKTIRYLNFKPEIADKYQKISEEYEKETGIKVIVETAANNTYEQTLTAKMATDDAPTIFQKNGPARL